MPTPETPEAIEAPPATPEALGKLSDDVAKKKPEKSLIARLQTENADQSQKAIEQGRKLWFERAQALIEDLDRTKASIDTQISTSDLPREVAKELRIITGNLTKNPLRGAYNPYLQKAAGGTKEQPKLQVGSAAIQVSIEQLQIYKRGLIGKNPEHLRMQEAAINAVIAQLNRIQALDPDGARLVAQTQQALNEPLDRAMRNVGKGTLLLAGGAALLFGLASTGMSFLSEKEEDRKVSGLLGIPIAVWALLNWKDLNRRPAETIMLQTNVLKEPRFNQLIERYGKESPAAWSSIVKELMKDPKITENYMEHPKDPGVRTALYEHLNKKCALDDAARTSLTNALVNEKTMKGQKTYDFIELVRYLRQVTNPTAQKSVVDYVAMSGWAALRAPR